jgi:hypothetical protein
MENTVFKLSWSETGKHVRVRVFAGSDRDHLVLTGSLTLLVSEWETFRDLLLQGPAVRLGVIFAGDTLAECGNVLIEKDSSQTIVDYSQLEIRLLSHFSDRKTGHRGQGSIFDTDKNLYEEQGQ